MKEWYTKLYKKKSIVTSICSVTIQINLIMLLTLFIAVVIRSLGLLGHSLLGSPKEEHTRTKGLSKVYCSGVTAGLSRRWCQPWMQGDLNLIRGLRLAFRWENLRRVNWRGEEKDPVNGGKHVALPTWCKFWFPHKGKEGVWYSYYRVKDIGPLHLTLLIPYILILIKLCYLVICFVNSHFL